MISAKSITLLAGNPLDLCPREWMPVNHLQRCRATGAKHLCVGDVGHHGKHVCPCGVSRRVGV